MAFVDTALVAVRESLEAFLILGILLGIAVKTGSPEARRPLLWGALAAFVLSILLGIVAQGVAKELYASNDALFEGFASLLAVAVLTYMIVWMYRHTQGMMGVLHTKTKQALQDGRSWALAGIAFLAVLREGIETVVFTAGKFPTDGVGVTLFALLAGILVSAVIAFLVFAGFLKLSIEKFMAATGLVLVVIAAGLFAYGVHELGDAKVFTDPTDKAYDFSAWLPHKGGADSTINTLGDAVGAFLHGLIVYRPSPTWLEVGAYLAYLLPMGAWVIGKLRRPHGAGRPPVET